MMEMNKSSKTTILLGIVSGILVVALYLQYNEASKSDKAKEAEIKTVETSLDSTKAEL